ncbi:MAG TPA: gluconate 2-dehydrogenase subunit 3 family protein [Candidatus Bathyarchaeia archaeon]|nr:gluconate 2-dehydrogenase subunit 3 family protein [Candidatus Bathyarchaeia archaeon]
MGDFFMSYQLDKNYNSLDRMGKWDPETREVIRNRIAAETGAISTFEFLTDREGETLEILIDALMPQDPNDPHKTRIAEIIDRDLQNDIKGVRYGKNPWPREFYQKGLADFAREAKEIFGKPIEDFSQPQVEKYISAIFERKTDDFLHRFLKRVLADATAIYFSHPAGWNKIGFPGPAFPEGYPYLNCGEKEDWEPNYK